MVVLYNRLNGNEDHSRKKVLSIDSLRRRRKRKRELSSTLTLIHPFVVSSPMSIRGN